ncbi:MAG: PD-(D/E)XK nuclease family protein, partial [Bacteroidales bacterium]|nr:PD-(D/E)XK nuclease family protein [Bacteroidales bacterium]
GFSPSALNTYRKCSLRYYYESVLGIKPSAELEEDIDTSELGTNIHKVLENIFLPFKGREIKADELPDKKEIDNIVEKHFHENVFKNSRKESGENYFMLSVAKTQIEAFIEEQKKFLADHESTLIDVEDNLEYNLSLDKDLSVKLHGVADRIDKVDGRTRICDYKSGTVKEADLILEKEDKISDKFFQVMQYSWLYAKKYNINTVEAGIFPLQNLRTFYLPAVITGNGTVFGKEQIQLFEKHLKTLVSDIFDENHPFEQNTKNCKFCPFTNLCGVEVKSF